MFLLDEPVDLASSEPRTVDLDAVVIGGGILGTAVAALASLAGYRVLLLRLQDVGRPRADTLRNQGWLQSGLLYKLEDFADENEYRNVARTTYFGGREMLRECEMSHSSERGVLRVLDPNRIAETEYKARLLKLPESEFRRLETNEARDLLLEMYEPNSTYYTLPDSPFDEAGVLRYLRARAMEKGAEFVQLTEPVSLEPITGTTRIRCGQTALESPVTLVAAGAGSLPLMTQAGYTLSAELRRTPLFVHSGTCGLAVPLLADVNRGFSVLRHIGNSSSSGAIVIGTKSKKQPVEFVPPDQRRIPDDEIVKFKKCLHPELDRYVSTGRFTAGYEVIPKPPVVKSFVEPWIEDCGNILFASPGRATLGLAGAKLALASLISKIAQRNGKQFRLVHLRNSLPWDNDIHMHFEDHYDFDDKE